MGASALVGCTRGSHAPRLAHARSAPLHASCRGGCTGDYHVAVALSAVLRDLGRKPGCHPVGSSLRGSANGPRRALWHLAVRTHVWRRVGYHLGAVEAWDAGV